MAKDDEPPWDPASADLLDITGELTSVDTREFVSGLRYYQVWRNSGSSVDQAVARQPRLHAEGAVVAPIQQLSLREDGGRVIGQWYVLSGIGKVHVYRIPIERAGRSGLDSAYELDTGDANLSGFIDRDPGRGKRYLYRFYTQVEINGVDTLSQPVSQQISVSSLLSPVDDLRRRGHAVAAGQPADLGLVAAQPGRRPAASGHGSRDEWLFDLSWTPPPSGRVVVYRTMAPPTAGLEAETRDESALPGAGSARRTCGSATRCRPSRRGGPGCARCPARPGGTASTSLRSRC